MTERVGFAFGALALASVGFLPQFGGPGYEAALAGGVILPSTAAVVTALVVTDSRRDLLPAVARGFQTGASFALIGFVIVLLHGLRVGFCDPGEGLLLYALGPAFGSVLGGVSGALAGYAAWRWLRRRRSIAVCLALLGPLGGIVVSLLRFYTSPMVFAYDPYFGYFSGPLYDTVIRGLGPLVTYRFGSLCTLGAIAALAAFVASTRGSWRERLRARPNLAATCLLAVLASVAVSVNGAALGHFSTSSSIRRELSRQASVGRCDIVHSPGVLAADARRLGRECHAHLGQIERFFGARGPERVLVYLFANEAEKGRLMGAARTYVAKPWRGEVYVQAAGFPHPVLGHELAHVVSASFAPGPFRVAGPLGGWIPDPGRIEGLATAASPDEDDALTLEQWAAAMQQLRLLPSLPSLFRLSFLGHNAAQAYTASGAFIRFLRRDGGAEVVRRWYRGEPLDALVGMDLRRLESRWHESLRNVHLPPAALASARSRFDRPAFFARRCPRVIDRKAAEAAGRLAAGDLQGATQGFREVLELDRHDSGARLGLAACAARAGHSEAAMASYAALAIADDASAWAKLAAQEARGDLLLRAGNGERAREVYGTLASKVVDDDRLRTLDVKRIAGSGLARESIVLLLIGDSLGPSWDAAAPKLGEWSARNPELGLADYLIGRNLLGRGRLRDAQSSLDRALERELPEPRVLDEALRLRVIVGCALEENGDRGARTALARLLARGSSAARREGLERFAERCGLSAQEPE